MVFLCQKDSYKKEVNTKVVSCKASKLAIPLSANQMYEVILEDSLLFPKGGGQPDDRGTINGIPVLSVMRQGGDAICLVETPIDEGTECIVRVDWQRRFDHMQQHSSQHLLTALAEDLYNLHTTSWSLGDDVSFIELDSPSISQETIDELEEIANEKIRDCVPVNVSYYEQGAEELKEVRTRLELPEDHAGLIRVVSIDGIDKNTCCGTHVANLSHLQAIKLLYVEKGKRKKSNLYFVAGDRLLRYLGKCVAREKALTGIFKCRPEEQVQMAEKLQKTLKLSQKNSLNVIRDLAVAEAQKFNLLSPKPSYYSLHRKEGDLEFMTIFANEVKYKDVLLFLTVGEDNGTGQMMLAGKEDVVSELGPQLCDILGGKGILKGGRFQAKVSHLAKQRGKAEELVRGFVELAPNKI